MSHFGDTETNGQERYGSALDGASGWPRSDG